MGDDRHPLSTAAEPSGGAGPSEAQLRQALDGVIDPHTGKGLTQSKRVESALIRTGGRVNIVLLTRAGEKAEVQTALQHGTERAIQTLPGVATVAVAFTSHRPSGEARAPADDPAKSHGREPSPRPPGGPPQAGRIIAVASGKGGVGKSTLAINLAIALARSGHKIGLMDADIYGPSAPLMLGLKDAKPRLTAEKKIVPLSAFGIEVMSIGFMVDPDAAVIWRGPMVAGAVNQLLFDVAWGELSGGRLDALIVDMPPGTGDAQLTLVQKAALGGAIVISTPQEMALIDARRALAMFEKTRTPVLGLVENMAYFLETPEKRVFLFGEGGVRRLAASANTPFLGEIPLDPRLREAGDAGAPLVAAAPESAGALAIMSIAKLVADKLWMETGSKQSSEI